MPIFLFTLGFFALFMLALGVGVLLRGRGLKGPCKGTGCTPRTGPNDKNSPEYGVSHCGRTIHTPMK
jgi:hypothetical protein